MKDIKPGAAIGVGLVLVGLTLLAPELMHAIIVREPTKNLVKKKTQRRKK